MKKNYILYDSPFNRLHFIPNNYKKICPKNFWTDKQNSEPNEKSFPDF